MQVSAVFSISWDGFKRKVTGFPQSPGGLFSLLGEDFGDTNGSCDPSSLPFSVGFGYLIVLGAFENAPPSLFKPKYFCNDFPSVTFLFCYRSHLDQR